MRYLQAARIVVLVSCWLLSAIALGTSADLNAMSKPPFHFTELLFPFAMGLVSIVLVYPAIIYLGRARKPGERRLLYVPPFIEFPAIGVWGLVWGGAAHIDTEAWYPVMGFTYFHCDQPEAQGLVDPQTGLSVPGVCQTLRTAHGCSWLIPLIGAIGIAAMGVPFLYFLFTRGWTETVWTPISEGTFKRPSVEKETESM